MENSIDLCYSCMYNSMCISCSAFWSSLWISPPSSHDHCGGYYLTDPYDPYMMTDYICDSVTTFTHRCCYRRHILTSVCHWLGNTHLQSSDQDMTKHTLCHVHQYTHCCKNGVKSYWDDLWFDLIHMISWLPVCHNVLNSILGICLKLTYYHIIVFLLLQFIWFKSMGR